MKNNIFWKPVRNKLEIISFHLPFVPFEQTWTINGEIKIVKRFACNCFVDGEPRIANVCLTIAKDVEKYVEKKALMSNAVVEASIFLDAPINQSPMQYNYVISCYDSHPSFIKFPWNLSSKIAKIKEIVIGTDNKKTTRRRVR